MPSAIQCSTTLMKDIALLCSACEYKLRCKGRGRLGEGSRNREELKLQGGLWVYKVARTLYNSHLTETNMSIYKELQTVEAHCWWGERSHDVRLSHKRQAVPSTFYTFCTHLAHLAHLGKFCTQGTPFVHILHVLQMLGGIQAPHWLSWFSMYEVLHTSLFALLNRTTYY